MNTLTKLHLTNIAWTVFHPERRFSEWVAGPSSPKPFNATWLIPRSIPLFVFGKSSLCHRQVAGMHSLSTRLVTTWTLLRLVDGSTRVREGERKGASERELTSRRQGGVNLIATAAYTRNDPETEEERGWCDMELDHSVTRWKILRQPQTDDVGGICMLSEEVQMYSLTRKPSTAHSVLEFRLCQWDRSKRKAGSCPRR